MIEGLLILILMAVLLTAYLVARFCERLLDERDQAREAVRRLLTAQQSQPQARPMQRKSAGVSQVLHNLPFRKLARELMKQHNTAQAKTDNLAKAIEESKHA